MIDIQKSFNAALVPIAAMALLHILFAFFYASRPEISPPLGIIFQMIHIPIFWIGIYLHAMLISALLLLWIGYQGTRKGLSLAESIISGALAGTIGFFVYSALGFISGYLLVSPMYTTASAALEIVLLTNIRYSLFGATFGAFFGILGAFLSKNIR